MAQQRVISDFERAIRDAGASPREGLALQEAGIVESGLRDLHHGDADSTGSLQQRPSQGWGPAGEGAYKDALQFLEHAKAINRKGFKGSAGELAQAVQRSAYPGRYDKAKASAVGTFGGGATAVASSAGRSNSGGPSVGSTPDLVSILHQASAPAAPAPSSPLQAPGFAARAVTPEGYQPVVTQGAPQTQQAPDVGDLAQQVLGTVDTSAPASSEGAQPQGSGAGALPSGGGRKVTIAAGANKPGTGLTPGLTKLLGELPFDVTVGTGTNHSTLTVNGKVSDHVSGNAADIPATGKGLTSDLARSLATYAGGRTVQWMRNDGRTVNVKVTPENVMTLAAAGGLFNVPYGEKRRIQVIGNTHIGGDHTNHLHVGVSAIR